MSNAIKISNLDRAKLAAKERWHPSIPKSTHSGILVIGGQEIACDVLEDGRRVLRKQTFLRALGKGRTGGKELKRGNELDLPIFLLANNLTPYLQPEIIERGRPINYKSHDNRKIIGYDATILPEACTIYVKADSDNALYDSQKKIAQVCKSMLYGLATVGIISLVDDVTGYVEERSRTELQKILEKYISEDLRKWTQKFPNEFFKQIYRLHGWEYPKFNKNHHPQCVGKIINKYIYEALPPGVLDELKRKNPNNENGIRKFRHHQFISEDIGDDNLKKQITQVITLMKVSDNMDMFKSMIEKIKD